MQRGAKVTYHDPYVATAQVNGIAMRSTALTAAQLKKLDCAVVLTNHSNVDYALVRESVPLIVDTRNQYGNQPGRAGRVVKL